MKRFLISKSLLLLIISVFFTLHVKSQAFDINSFFSDQAITFYTPDSNNMIYNEVKNQIEMDNLLDSIFPFYTDEFYGAYSNIKINNDDTTTFLPGLHEQLPTFDSRAREIKGKFILNNKTDYWYSYYKKSIQDTTTAILIFPGSGANESFQIADNNPDDYHNMDCLVKEKALTYGDVYIIVKPNEDFRTIWKTVSDTYYGKLNYDVMTPYTTYNGKAWAANLYIELLAELKYLKSKYKKVIAIGLSNGGFPILACGLEAGIDGINCASGLSVSSYTGFPVPNDENPYFSGIFDYYSLDSIKSKIIDSEARVLFTYGSGECCTNAYEYDTHELQNYLNTPLPSCNTKFFYDFGGHTFSCRAIDSLFSNVKASPKLEIQLIPISCSLDSLPVSIKVKGQSPFAFDLYKDDVLYKRITSNENIVSISVTAAGNYQAINVVDATNVASCKSEKFSYVKPTLPNITSATNIGLDCIHHADSIKITCSGTQPFKIFSDLSGYNGITFQAAEFTIGAPQGNYSIFSIVDSSGCSNIINFPITVTAEHDTLNTFLQNTPILTLENNYLIAPLDANKYDWYKNGVLIDSTNQNKLITQGSGDYYAILTNLSGCTSITNSISLSYASGINIYPNPTVGGLNILIDEKFMGNWNFAIYDNTGKLISRGQNSSAYKLIDLRSLGVGIYNLLIEYNNAHGEKIRKNNRIIKENH